jgi:hypothetical protein
VFEKVERSPYFRRHFEPLPQQDHRARAPAPHPLQPRDGQARSLLGFNVFCFVIDEAAFGTENFERDADSVRDLFLALNQRRRSRFGRLGWDGLFTSPQSEHASSRYSPTRAPWPAPTSWCAASPPGTPRMSCSPAPRSSCWTATPTRQYVGSAPSSRSRRT